MRPLIVKNLLICGKNTPEAFYTDFEEGINVITSQYTSRGKSSVLRAIAYSLGAEANYDSIFEQTEKVFVISLKYDNNEYKIVRCSRYFALYKNGDIVDVFSDDVGRLSNFYEKEFGFSIYLTSREGTYSIAPPGYSLIPYFLDQDSSWKGKDTNPFKMGGQFVQDLNDIYYFHIGVIDIAYGNKKNDLFVYDKKSKALKKKADDLEQRIFELKEYCESHSVSLSKEDAEANLKLLESKISALLSAQQEIQSQIFEKENYISKYNIEIRSMEDLLKKLSSNESTNSISCPNCGYQFSGNEQRSYDIELIKDNIEYAKFMINRFREEIVPLKQRFTDISSSIESQKRFYQETKSGFEEYLKCQSVSILLEKLERDFSLASQELLTYENDTERNRLDVEEYDKQKYVANARFKDIYLEQLSALKINNLNRNRIVPFQKAQISGNKYVRSTLAFFLTILELKNERKFDNFNLPIIVDSPFEGDPDEINKEDVINAIVDYYDNYNLGSQLFVGLREGRKYFNNRNDINFVELETEEDHLLNEGMYVKNSDYIKRILDLVSRKFK